MLSSLSLFIYSAFTKILRIWKLIDYFMKRFSLSSSLACSSRFFYLSIKSLFVLWELLKFFEPLQRNEFDLYYKSFILECRFKFGFQKTLKYINQKFLVLIKLVMLLVRVAFEFWIPYAFSYWYYISVIYTEGMITKLNK